MLLVEVSGIHQRSRGAGTIKEGQRPTRANALTLPQQAVAIRKPLRGNGYRARVEPPSPFLAAKARDADSLRVKVSVSQRPV